MKEKLKDASAIWKRSFDFIDRFKNNYRREYI